MILRSKHKLRNELTAKEPAKLNEWVELQSNFKQQLRAPFWRQKLRISLYIETHRTEKGVCVRERHRRRKKKSLKRKILRTHKFSFLWYNFTINANNTQSSTLAVNKRRQEVKCNGELSSEIQREDEELKFVSGFPLRRRRKKQKIGERNLSCCDCFYG